MTDKSPNHDLYMDDLKKKLPHSTCCKAEIKQYRKPDLEYDYCGKCGRPIMPNEYDTPTPPPVPDKQHVADMLHTSSNATRTPPVPSEIEGEIRKILQDNIASQVYYESRNSERILLEGLRKSEKALTALLTHHTSEKVKEEEKKRLALYMSVIIWKMRDEIREHLSLAAENGKDEFKKHLDIHLCNIDSMDILMNAVKLFYPEIYQHKGKSIKQHYDEVNQYLATAQTAEGEGE